MRRHWTVIVQCTDSAVFPPVELSVTVVYASHQLEPSPALPMWQQRHSFKDIQNIQWNFNNSLRANDLRTTYATRRNMKLL